MNVYNRFFGQTCLQNIAKFNYKQRIRFAIGTRNCLSCMFGSKSCHIRVAIDTVSSARADTTFDEWTYARVFIHLHFLFRAFSNLCVSVNTLSLSRVDTVISRSGSPHDASHLPSNNKQKIIRYVSCDLCLRTVVPPTMNASTSVTVVIVIDVP